MKLKFVDVSKHNGKIDWKKVKNDGVVGAIIRCGYGGDIESQDDEYFDYNYENAKANGLLVGVYLYSYANTLEKARSEANHTIRLLRGRPLDFPVFYDLEDAGTTRKCTKDLIANMADIYCTLVGRAGYKTGIYANKYWFTSILTNPFFNTKPKWVAQYHKECTYAGDYIGWQYTSSGKVDGISTRVDLNEFYTDFKESKPEASKDLPDITGYKGTSIAGALNSFGYDSSYSFRKALAKKLGIKNYKGTAEQNLKMIEMLGGEIVNVEVAPEYKVYVVKSGDTLSKIAKNNGSTVSELAIYNRIADPNRIFVGQEIRIPL